ncbi:MAG: TIGR03067 domain-containing protein [Planctomycetes bacterium]|nr:TIGR03067 domain-containing protein [Planctomycetota bacterium]
MARLPLAVALLMATTAFATEETRDQAKSDKELIQGTWEVVSSREGGREIPADKRAGLRILITADLLTFQPKDAKGLKDTLGIHFTLDSTKNPKEMDTTHELDPGQPITQLGIYSLEGDTLKLCLGGAGQPRPTRLESQAGDSSVSFVLKRAKNEGH